MTVKGQEYQGTHEQIINESIFYKCQKQIKTGNNTKTHKTRVNIIR
jgi:hypothetical protein